MGGSARESEWVETYSLRDHVRALFPERRDIVDDCEAINANVTIWLRNMGYLSEDDADACGCQQIAGFLGGLNFG